MSGVAVFASKAASLDPSSAVQCVASASRDGTIRLWDLASGASKGVLHGHDGWVRRVAAPALAPGEAATPAALEVADVIVSCGADKVSRARRSVLAPPDGRAACSGALETPRVPRSGKPCGVAPRCPHAAPRTTHRAVYGE